MKKGLFMTTAEHAYALDMRMRVARRDVVRPLTGREVAMAIAQARDEGQDVSLDLSGMKRIVIDPIQRTARIQPGISTRELADAAAPHDLAPLVDHRGSVIADDLLAAQVVRPDGALVRADSALLREIRSAAAGVGQAVGIVVDATYRLHGSMELGR
jgi:FAD/FMN-containing dehydrogenase